MPKLRRGLRRLAVGKATAMVLRNTAWSAQEATNNEAMLK